MQFTRRQLLARLRRATTGLALLTLAGHAHRAAAAKARKEDFAYQDRPRGGQHCASCRQFTPGAAGTGTCAVVEGVVSVDGWCAAYTPIGGAHATPQA